MFEDSRLRPIRFHVQQERPFDPLVEVTVTTLRGFSNGIFLPWFKSGILDIVITHYAKVAQTDASIACCPCPRTEDVKPTIPQECYRWNDTRKIKRTLAKDPDGFGVSIRCLARLVIYFHGLEKTTRQINERRSVAQSSAMADTGGDGTSLLMDSFDTSVLTGESKWWLK